jgi:hypothetical protein
MILIATPYSISKLTISPLFKLSGLLAITLLLITSNAHAKPPIEGTTIKLVPSDIATSADLVTSVFAADID